MFFARNLREDSDDQLRELQIMNLEPEGQILWRRRDTEEEKQTNTIREGGSDGEGHGEEGFRNPLTSGT